MSSGPIPSPIKLLISRKLADAVARIGRGTKCWIAVLTGPSHKLLSELPISSSGQAIHKLGANSPSAQAGAAISHANAGSLANQPRSARPSLSANQPPAKTPAQPPTKTRDARKLAVGISSSLKLS